MRKNHWIIFEIIFLLILLFYALTAWQILSMYVILLEEEYPCITLVIISLI